MQCAGCVTSTTSTSGARAPETRVYMVVSNRPILTGIPEEQDMPAPVTTTTRLLLETAEDRTAGSTPDAMQYSKTQTEVEVGYWHFILAERRASLANVQRKSDRERHSTEVETHAVVDQSVARRTPPGVVSSKRRE